MGLRVISTTSNDQKANKLKALGADHVINYQSEPDWAKVVHELTDKRGVEKIVEVVGPETFKDSLQAAATDGEIALVGFLGQSDKKFGYFDLFGKASVRRSEEHTSELQSRGHLVCR